MFFHSKQSKEAKRLSWKVRQYLQNRFMLSEEYLGELRSFEYDGVINEREVLRILIFDPRLVRRQHISLQNHVDLEQHPEALLYEGYEDDARGSLYIENRHAVVYSKTTSSQRL